MGKIPSQSNPQMADASSRHNRRLPAPHANYLSQGETRMPQKFKAAAIAMVIGSSFLILGCMSDRDARYGRYHHESAAVSVDFGDVAFGYQDGYWDNGRVWHQWSDDRHRQSYRNHQASRYNDWKHDRDGGDGWRQDNSR